MPRLKRAKGEITTTLSEVSQEIDVAHYLGDNPTNKQKVLFSELAVSVIENRTLDGKTINGGKFKKYTQKYADLKGVTRDSVDMFGEGDMFDSIDRDTNSETDKTIHLEVAEGVNTKKAFNHTTGDTNPKREWWGLTDSEAKSIAKVVKSKKKKKAISLAEVKAALDLLDIE